MIMGLVLYFSLALLVGMTVAFLIAYFPRYKLWFSAIKPQKRIVNEKKEKIAVCIPARNESKVIEDLFINLSKQTYDKDNFDVYAVIKEKTDKTIQIAKKYGVKIVVAPDQTCKGDALDVCFKQILKDSPEKYAGFLIIDADCLLKEDCLFELNNAIASGADVISCKKIVKNYLINDEKAKGLAGCCNGLIWTMIDDMGNRGKTDRNIVNMTIGTGIFIRRSLIERLGGWTYNKTLTEDMELMNDCVVSGYSTFYYSYAQMYVEEASGLSMTNKRRTRWMHGLMDSLRLYEDKLDKAAVTKGEKRDRRYINYTWTVIFYFGFLVLYSIANLILFTVLLILRNDYWIMSLCLGLSGLFLIYFWFFMLTVFCMIVDRKHIKLKWYKKIALLFAHPLFYMGYIPITYFAVFGKRKTEWEVIERIDYKVKM